MEFDLLTIIIAVIGAAAGIWKTFDAKFWKKMAKESFDVVNAVKNATDEKSPGGKKLTMEEKAEIGEEAMDIIVPLWDKLSSKFNKKK